ncbi:hypothetical protein FMJ45_14170 [Klebsiella michiganensis]|nr:hypothetical protein [Klebsiella michiganensis]MBZ6602275.1 hypothetical protein [Klebsiella michiganensis]MBZ7391611.1 hypothetical protein [Klebsiella michiganensis]MBZ7452580.1 hypothetical protein [Klebsiella michiganensis]MBZ7619465.1 hypothetical protein [Klebsiella michiganensis]
MPGSSIAPPSAAPACNKRRREIENVSPIPAPETRKKKASGGAYAPLDAFILRHTCRRWPAAQNLYSIVLFNAKPMPDLRRPGSRALAHLPGAFEAKTAPSAGNICPLIVHLLLRWYLP